MNELPAIVRDGDTVEVAGTVVQTPGATGFAPGERVLLLVRPEDVRVADADSAAAGLSGTVTARTFEGAATIVQVRLDIVDLLASANLPSSVAGHLSPGDRVAVMIDGARSLCERISAEQPDDVVESVVSA
jgi:ABC-type Fe3+/spermidine/putrescine transport system ATPase subunit